MQPADRQITKAFRFLKEVYPPWSPRRPWRARDILPQDRHDPELIYEFSSRRVNASDKLSDAHKFRPATVHHALLRLTHHVQHPVQKQGRPVPHRRPGQHSGKAEYLNELERTNRNARDAMRWTGSPKGENAGCSRVNGARGSGAT
jgi:hypothetical protein